MEKETDDIRIRKKLRIWDSGELKLVFSKLEHDALALISDVNLEEEPKFERKFRLYGDLRSEFHCDCDDLWYVIQHPMFDLMTENVGAIAFELKEKLMGEYIRCEVRIYVDIPQDVQDTVIQIGKIRWVTPEPSGPYKTLACY